MSRAEGTDKDGSVLKIMYADADGWVGTGKELAFMDRVKESKPDMTGIGETKLNKDIRSHVASQDTITRKERKKTKGEGLALLVSEKKKFHEIQVHSGPSSQYILGKIVKYEIWRIIMMIDNPIRGPEEPDQFSNENNKGTIQMV